MNLDIWIKKAAIILFIVKPIVYET